MKKSIFIQHSDAGFYLPYITFVCMIVFMMLGTSIALYQNHVRMTHKMLEWTKVETMVQMTTASFVNDGLYKNNETGEATYNFPDGKVDMSYKQETPEKWLLNITVKTKRDFVSSDFHIVTVSEPYEEAEDST